MFDTKNILDYPTLDKSLLNYPNKSQPLRKNSDFELTEKVCFTPYELFDSISIAQGFGWIAEAIISHKLLNYYEENKIAPIDIYNDYSLAGIRDKGYIGFLRLKNPNLSEEAISEISNSSLKRPDILLDNGVVRSFYEIKPHSDSGIRDGEQKLKKIEEYFKKYNLGYKRGDKLKVREIELGELTILVENKKIPVKFYFSLEYEAGLITYKLCVETAWRFLIEKNKTELVIKAIYDYFVEIIKSAKELKNRLNELIEEGQLTELSGVALLLVVSILAGIYISTASLALITALTVSVVSLELVIKKRLGIEDSKAKDDSQII